MLFFKDFTFCVMRECANFFHKAWQAGLVTRYFISFAKSLVFALKLFISSLYSRGIQYHNINEEKIKKLQKTAQGLYSLLPIDERFTYSVLLPVSQPQLSIFRESLKSVLQQSPFRIEILIGLMQPTPKEIESVLVEALEQYSTKVKIFHFNKKIEKEEVINQLAEDATGNFLFLMGEEDWIRPDLFFRYEQTLRLFRDPEKRVLYCHLNALTQGGYFIPDSEYPQPEQFCFPFFFKFIMEKGFLVPTLLWKKAKGLDLTYKGAIYENLLLNLDLKGAAFQNVPLCLYSVRFRVTQGEKKSQDTFLASLSRYTTKKQLNWEWLPGYNEESVRAIPPLSVSDSIQVIIPYKDEKNLTMKCIQSLIKQKNVHYKITAVDNGSVDQSIAEEIKALGGEVITVKEPFNYSRLNNIAVKSTQKALECNVILFLNNDVELEEEALSEMLRWVNQPNVGIVGCRLHYPDGLLQHGGVKIIHFGKDQMRWEHIEKSRSFEQMNQTKNLGIYDAVTAACAMMKREIFLEVGGFDEIWYPIAYSDTHLATKLAAKGLMSFYTPYAVGIHHESVSRKTAIEDFESSWWLHEMKKQT